MPAGENMILIRQLIGQGFPCLFYHLTGFYCPGCGGTRAVRYLLQGRILKSIQYHPLVPYMAAVILAETARGLRAKKGGTHLRGHYEYEVYVGIGIVLVNWAVKNWALAVMGVDLIP